MCEQIGRKTQVNWQIGQLLVLLITNENMANSMTGILVYYLVYKSTTSNILAISYIA